MALFSSQHIEAQRRVHEECPAYGSASLVFAPMVSELINANKVQTLLDYGSGLGQVPSNLELDHEVKVQLYDPAVEQFVAEPQPAEMLICLDVLDVVEQDCIDEVLDHLQRLTQKMAFISVNTAAADESANKGLKYHPVEWWLPKLMQRFELHYFSRIGNGFVVVVKAFSNPNAMN